MAAAPWRLAYIQGSPGVGNRDVMIGEYGIPNDRMDRTAAADLAPVANGAIRILHAAQVMSVGCFPASSSYLGFGGRLSLFPPLVRRCTSGRGTTRSFLKT